MKKIFTLTILLSSLFTVAAFAQTKVGVRAGLNSASWKGDAMQSLNDLVTITKGYVDTRLSCGWLCARTGI